MIAPLSIILPPKECSCCSQLEEQPVITKLESTDDKIAPLFPKIFPSNASEGQKHEDFSVAQFIRFLKQIKLRRELSKISDHRDLSKIKYSNEAILQWSLSIFFFRRGSKNSLQTTLDTLKIHQRTAILNYLGLKDNGTFPHRTTVDDYLAEVDGDEINDLLVVLFRWANRNKVFYNHSGYLLPNNRFHLACDGVWVHKYTKPHCLDEKGNNACPYCLPRTHNKGKPEEITYWVHAFVNLVFIFPGGMQLPIHAHALKAEQIQLDSSASAEKFKQEYELQAAHIIFRKLKEKLGNLPITLLTDSLYANEPMIQLCEQLGWEYLIVRQIGSLKTLCSKCDELEKTKLYQKSYQAQRIITR